MVWSGKEVHSAADTTFFIYPTGETYLSIKSSKSIQWRAPDPSTGSTIPVYAHFLYGDSPCNIDKILHRNNDLSRCELADKLSGGYQYECWSTDNLATRRVICKDPGIDPNSDVGQRRQYNPNAKAAPKPGMRPAAATDGPIPTDLNIHLTCSSGDHTVKAYDTSTQNPILPSYTITSAIFWEVPGFKQAIGAKPLHAGDPDLCTVSPNGSGWICAVSPDAKGKAYTITMGDDGGSCKNNPASMVVTVAP